MDDLVDRLRRAKNMTLRVGALCRMADEAADRIEALEARVAELEDVLGVLVFCEDAEFYPGAIEKSSPHCIDFEEWHKTARAALKRKDA